MFHPFTIFIPTLVIVLKDMPALHAVGWVVFIAAIILVPALVIIRWARRRERYVYQRQTRHPLYVTFGGSMLLCTGLAIYLDTSSRLVFALLCLCVWVPLQAVINARVTKISGHTAVLAGIVSALVALGDLNSLPLVLGAVLAVVATAWARIVTGHHTLRQVSLGILVSVLSVLIACGVMRL